MCIQSYEHNIVLFFIVLFIHQKCMQRNAPRALAYTHIGNTNIHFNKLDDKLKPLTQKPQETTRQH